MLSIALVDDQQIYINIIKNLLAKHFDNIKVHTYNSVQDIDQAFDLLLLDIHMPDIDGIDFSKKNRNIRIIFVTSLDTRIKEAFGSNIYGYVSKRNLENELIDKVSEVIDIIKNDTYVSFKVAGTQLDIKMSDIMYCQYLGSRNVAIIYKEQLVKIGDTTLKKVMDTVDDRFIKINRDTIVNKNMISDYSDQYVYLKNMECKFEVSVRKRALVRKYFFKRYQ